MKNSQKGFANIALIVVIIAIVAVGGYFVLKPKTNIAPQPSPTAEAVNSQSSPQLHESVLSLRVGFEPIFWKNSFQAK